MKTLENFKTMSEVEKKLEIDHIKTLIFYSERAATETKDKGMIFQAEKLKEFLRLVKAL